MRAAIAHSGNSVANRARGHRRGCSGEVNESDFSGDKELERSRSFKLRPEEPGQRPHLGRHKRSSDAVVEGGREVALEVIIHLGFDLAKTAHIEGRPGAESDEIHRIV